MCTSAVPSLKLKLWASPYWSVFYVVFFSLHESSSVKESKQTLLRPHAVSKRQKSNENMVVITLVSSQTCFSRCDLVNVPHFFGSGNFFSVHAACSCLRGSEASAGEHFCQEHVKACLFSREGNWISHSVVPVWPVLPAALETAVSFGHADIEAVLRLWERRLFIWPWFQRSLCVRRGSVT